MVNPDSSMEISAMEAVPLEQLDPKAVADGLAEVTRRTAKDETERAEVQLHQEIYQAMNAALSRGK